MPKTALAMTNTARERGNSDPAARSVARQNGRKRGASDALTSTSSQHLDVQDGRRDDVESDDEARRKRRKRTSQAAARVRIRETVAMEEVEISEGTEERAGMRTPPRKSRANSTGGESHGARSPGTPGQRRAVVHWTPEEEAELIKGVRRHGLGHWRKILDEGCDIFHEHRTNVDLKDKWKNLARREAKSPSKKTPQRIVRRAAARLSITSQVLDEDEDGDDQAEEWDDWHGRETSSVARDSMGGFDHGQSAAGESEDDAVEAPSTHEVRARRTSSPGEDSIQLVICTDKLYPHTQSLSISPRKCPTISALKRELTRRLLDDSPLPTNLQLVSIKTRRLLADLEAVDECVQRDGHELFLLYDP